MTNKIYDAFDEIKANHEIKESTKQVLFAKKSRKTDLFRRKAFRRTLEAACIALFLAIGIGGYSLVRTPVSYVSIDVNPSIELALNRLDRVVSATAYNEEGEEILEPLSLEGKKYTEAIDEIVNCEAMKPYLALDSELVFTVAASKGQEKKLKEGVEKHCGHNQQNYQYSLADFGVVQQAHDHALSLGKYNAYLQLSQYDDTITPDDCRHMSMSEIHCITKEHEQGSSCPNRESENPQGSHDQESKTSEESDNYLETPSKGHHHHNGSHK